MCGIVGYFDRRKPITPDLLCMMRDRMVHRGPDDAGHWLSVDNTAGLGHRRLSIIDLSAMGHQPMLSADGRHVIVLNGEIYNYREVKKVLQAQGVTFHSNSDTEVLLEAFRHWGTGCLAKIIGMFSFAIYDTHAETLFAARDRAGEKPFFFFHDATRFTFASELKALLAYPGSPRKLNLDGLNQYLAYGYVPGGLCILEGYQKLPAGHQLTFDLRSGRLNVEQYWSLPLPVTRTSDSIDELTDELERLLTSAVAGQLVADVPVGILLSGGLDSSLVTAIASRVSPSKIRTYSISFPGHALHDETEHAVHVARYLGTEHLVLPAEGNSFDILPKLVEQFDEPIADSSMVPTFMVTNLIRQHCTVALGGDGGDELFGGYIHYPWVTPLNRLRLLQLHRLGHEAALSKSIPLGTPGRSVGLGLLGPHSSEISFTRLLDPDLRRAISRVDLSRASQLPELYRKRILEGRHGSLDRATALDFQTYMCDDILVKVDRASMLNSLEVRAPFLDRSVIEFAFGRVPAKLKVQGRERKKLLRRLAKKMLPPDFDSRRKQGFTIPLASWLKSEWRPFVDDLLEGNSPLFNSNYIRENIGYFRRSDRGANRIFQLALLEAWRKRFRIDL